MSTREFRETVAGSSQLLLRVFGHIIVPPLISFVASFVALFWGIFLIAIFGQHMGRAMCFTFVGFSGVFAGACFLPQRARGLGAIGLTLLGMIYYSGFIADWGYVMTDEGKFFDEHDRSLMQLILLGFGGLLATILIAWLSSAARRRLQSRPPIAAS